MPIYTYRCGNCGVQFDVTQKFSDNPLTQCPECGKKALHKVYTPVGIVFKGSGFYATDHHSPSGQSWASGAKEPTEAKAESTPAETRPETKKTAESAKPATPAASSSSEKA